MDLCSYSRDIMKIMEKHGLNKMIKYKCVNNMPSERINKLNLTMVPTLVIKDSNKYCMYEGESEFKFIAELLHNKRELSIKKQAPKNDNNE